MWNLIQTARWAQVPAWDLAAQPNFWYWWYSVIMGVDQDLQTPPIPLDAHQLAQARAAEAAGVPYTPDPDQAARPLDPNPLRSNALTLEPAPESPGRVFRPTLPIR